MATETQQARVIVMSPFVGICHMQVCAEADATDEEILAVCNAQNPSGTTNGWSQVCRSEGDKTWGNTAPVPCANGGHRVHFLVSC